MALLDICGFDKTSDKAAIFDIFANTGAINAASGRFGSGEWGFNGDPFGNNTCVRTIRTIGDYSELYIGLAVRRGSSSGIGFFHLWDTGTQQINFVFSSTGKIEVRRGAYNATLITDSGANIWPADNVYRWIDIHVIISNTVGQVQLKVNNAFWINSAANLNTRAGTNNTVNQWGVGGGTSSNNIGVDDVHIADTTGTVNNSWLGERRVCTLRPNGAGDVANGVASTGGASVFTTIDETGTPNGDTDYNTITNVGDKDLFALSDLPMATGTIWGTMMSLWARKTDAATCDVSHIEKSGATETDGSGIGALSSYTFLQSIIREVNPATGNPYTIAEINALQAGYKRAA